MELLVQRLEFCDRVVELVFPHGEPRIALSLRQEVEGDVVRSVKTISQRLRSTASRTKSREEPPAWPERQVWTW